MGHRIGRGVVIVAVLGTHMVDNRVNDDLQTEFMRLFAHRNELSLGAKRVIGAVVQLEAGGLIVHPPSVLTVALQELSTVSTLLDLVGGRYLNGSEALFCDSLKVRFNVLEGPSPRLQNRTVIHGLGQAVVVFDGCLTLHIFIRRACGGYIDIRCGIRCIDISCRGSNDADGNAGHNE